jgi:hypothetical protein
VAGRPAKPADRRQRRNKRPELGVVEGGGVTVPTCPSGLLVKTQRSWEEFWHSPLARMIVPTDVPALERLFELRDMRTRAHRACARHTMVEGSQGQPVLNPLHRQITSLDSEIRQLEDRFALNLKSRQTTGLQLTKAALTLDDINNDLAEDEQRPDPRTVVQADQH